MIAGLNDVLAADPAFNKLKAKDKQLLSDTMMVQSAVIIMYATVGDENAKAASKTVARQALRFLTGSDTGVAPVTARPARRTFASDRRRARSGTD